MTSREPKGWLLDTHALIWSLYRDRRLSARAAALIDGDLPIYSSTVSFWEIALKRAGSGFDVEVDDEWHIFIPRELSRLNIFRLETEAADCRTMEAFPKHHRDPFDRMLIAQALSRGLGVISHDVILDDYGVMRAW